MVHICLVIQHIFLDFVTLAQEIFAIGLQQIKPKVRSIKAENSESTLNVSKT